MTSDSAIVKLVSREGDSFDVPLEVAKMSQLVADSFEEEESDSDDDEDTTKTIPLPKVSSEVLEKIIEYGNYYHQEEEMRAIQTPLKSARLEDLVQQWYVDFVNVDEKNLFALVSASNYMDIKPLLDLTCLAVSIVIKGKSATELREMFNVKAECSTAATTVLEDN